MLSNEAIDKMINSCGYGVAVPCANHEAFMLRRLVEHVHTIGVTDGISAASKCKFKKEDKKP